MQHKNKCQLKCLLCFQIKNGQNIQYFKMEYMILLLDQTDWTSRHYLNFKLLY